MKVLLISPNRLRVPYPVYPIGLDYVAAAIPSGHAVKILDLNHENSSDALQDTLTAFQPDLIGISIRNIDNTDGAHSRSFIADYAELLSTIRGNSKAPIVLGGSGFTIFAELLMQTLDADYGIPGDGERIADLIAALNAGSDPGAIPGILIKNAVGGALADNSLAPASRHFDPDAPHLSFYLNRSGMMNLQTKRGCPFRCIYCTYPQIDGQRLRLFDPDEVAQTALALEKAGAKYFFISDSTFNCNIPHSLEIAKAFLRAGISIPWGAFFAPLRVPEGYFETMAKAGLTHVEFGTEALSDDVLAAYGKPFSKADVFHAHRQALAAGIHVAHYIMPGGPGETNETLAETLDGLEQLEKSVFFFYCGIRIYPNTTLYDIALRDAQITGDEDLLLPRFYRSRQLDDAPIEETILKRAAGRNNWIIGTGNKTMERTLSRMYAHGHVGPLWEHVI